MKINISVCGRFHFHNYVRFISEAGFLNAFYYSHKYSTDYKQLGLSKTNTYNFPFKEYAVQLQGQYLQGRGKGLTYPLFFKFWERSVLNHWKKTDLYHYVNHGNSLDIIKKAKSEGSLILGECVNSHIDYMRQILTEEYELLGIKNKPKVYSWEKRMVDELAVTDYILAPSQFVKKSLVEKGIQEDRISVIPYGANLERFYPSKEFRKDKIFRVIVVAQLNPRKGHKYLLEAWRKLNLPNSELIFVGAMRPEMETILKPYEGLYSYKGVVKNEELIRYLHTSDLFVLPSIEEGCSVAPLEAMACGLPVIVSENTGADGYFQDGVNGFMVPTRSVEELADRILTIYEDVQLREFMRINNIRETQGDLSWQNYSKRLITLYSKLNGLK